MGEYCFADCNSLTSITLPEGITSLMNCCFSGCSSLTNISFPSSLKKLYDNIFKYATQNKRIIINATTPPDIRSYGDYTLIDSNCTLYVPKNYLATYKNTSPWSCAGAFYEGKPIESIKLPSDISFEKTEKNKGLRCGSPWIAHQTC